MTPGEQRVDPDQTPCSAASDHDIHCLHVTQAFLQNSNDKTKLDTPSFENGLVQKVEEEEFGHKLVKRCHFKFGIL